MSREYDTNSSLGALFPATSWLKLSSMILKVDYLPFLQATVMVCVLLILSPACLLTCTSREPRIGSFEFINNPRFPARASIFTSKLGPHSKADHCFAREKWTVLFVEDYILQNGIGFFHDNRDKRPWHKVIVPLFALDGGRGRMGVQKADMNTKILN